MKTDTPFSVECVTGEYDIYLFHPCFRYLHDETLVSSVIHRLDGKGLRGGRWRINNIEVFCPRDERTGSHQIVVKDWFCIFSYVYLRFF